MKVLVIGGGGREHAVISKLKESKRISTIIAMPGNAGISEIATCVNIGTKEIDKILEYLEKDPVDLVVVTPDDPLALGLVDALNERKIRAFGPVARAAEIESSKAFAKNLMKKYGIPTGDFEIFDNYEKALEFLENSKYPIVIKASGLALGKGVLICNSKQEAKDTVFDMMKNEVFGKSGHTIIIEEFLQGPEVTVLAFTDGKTISTMPSSQDHKRVFDGDKGLNTGGMGAFSPSKNYTLDIESYCVENIFIPTINALAQEGRKFKGVIYFQMMLTQNGPKVIEYNARFGDPETQALMPLLKTDLLDIFEAIIDERLDDLHIQWEDLASVTVVLASKGYPQDFVKGYEISGLDKLDDSSLTLYHMGTKEDKGRIVTNGGRVLSLTAKADTIDQAMKKVYKNIERVQFKDMHFRKDIGRK